MLLNDALNVLASQFGIEAQTLIDYANEDNIGGFHADRVQQQWVAGSLWAVEGQVLYALTRAMRPALVVEIGCWYGCSATHILSALEANGKGKLLSIDLDAGAGLSIPEPLRTRWKLATAEGAEYIRTHTLHADLVYEDASHDTAETINILSAIRDCINPRVTISHDAQHVRLGQAVCAAWDEVYGADNYSAVLIEPSDCGLAWRLT